MKTLLISIAIFIVIAFIALIHSIIEADRNSSNQRKKHDRDS